MDISSDNILLVGSLLLFTSILASKPSTRLGIPILLLFLIIGMLFGIDGLGINFSSPSSAQLIGNAALIIILFSGGMDTVYSEIKKVMIPGILLSTFGVLITALITGVFIFYLLKGNSNLTHFTFLEALLLASVMSSTDSASVFGILRGKNIQIKQKIKSLLEFESGSNDPMAYILVILLIQVITTDTSVSYFSILLDFSMQLVIGLLAGGLGGYLVVKLMNKIDLSNHSLYAVLLLSCAFMIYAFTNMIYGNGFLAVYIAGLFIGNKKFIHKKSISNFVDGLAWLFQIIMFLTLGLLVNPHDMFKYTIISVVIGLFLIFIGRPAAVFLCMGLNKSFTIKSKLFVSWVGLKGAVPIIFATYPLTAKLDVANEIFNIVFFITLISLLLQGTSIPFVAKKLGLESSSESSLNAFNMEFPDEYKNAMMEVELTEEHLRSGSLLMNIPLHDKTLAVMVKRKDKFIIPKGKTELKPGDKILLISDNESELNATKRMLGIKLDNGNDDNK
ncbi:MAG: potassium/proton antiporter [Bacteroidales bacterium]|nr:potassium/proton antiporter [Bacteroidales bacterium]